MGSEFRELVLGREFMDLLDEPQAAALPEVDLDALSEALLANMREQCNAYATYLVNAEKQRMALVNHKLEDNQALNLEAEHMVSALTSLETARLRIVERMLEAHPELAPAPAQLRCESLIPLINGELAGRLQEVRASLRGIIETLQRVLNVNAALVENGTRIIHTTIGIITSVVGRSRADKLTTYTRKGAVNVGKVQIRNLINRSV